MAEQKIFGYADKISVRPGDEISFFVHADGTQTVDAQLVRLIHGYGTGQLKRALAGFLQQHPLVARFATAPPEQGGGGVTVVELKE